MLNTPDFSQRLKSTYLWCLTPMIRVADWVSGTALRSFNSVWPWQEILVENRKLLLKVDELENYLIDMRELEDENARLRDLLAFQEEHSTHSLAARVIGRSPDLWVQSIVINRGARDGVHLDHPVVTRYGLVGLVSDVGQHASQVVLLTDLSFKVSGLIQSSRQEGIVRGEGQRVCSMNYVPNETVVHKQDVVITSGLGGLVPKGIVLGGIEQVELDEGRLFQNIVIRPAVQFSKLEEVLVLIT